MRLKWAIKPIGFPVLRKLEFVKYAPGLCILHKTLAGGRNKMNIRFLFAWLGLGLHAVGWLAPGGGTAAHRRFE